MLHGVPTEEDKHTLTGALIAGVLYGVITGPDDTGTALGDCAASVMPRPKAMLMHESVNLFAIFTTNPVISFLSPRLPIAARHPRIV